MTALVLLSLVVIQQLCGVWAGDQSETSLWGTWLRNEAGVEIVYQVPTGGASRGIVFFAHGCSHSSIDWWPKTKECPTCIGLPVERALVTAALKRGYVAVAQSSQNRKHRCWSDADMPHALATLKWIMSHLKLPVATTPVHLLGASSGGGFVGRLALKMRAKDKTSPRILSAIVQISLLRGDNEFAEVPADLGILFVHMSRDVFLAQMISSYVKDSNRRNIKELIVQPLPLEPNFFNAHSSHLSLEDSAKLVAALRDAEFINQDGLLVEDPRQSEWRAVARKALPHIIPEVDSLVADLSGISELLNLSWALHEITDENIVGVFEFMAQRESAAEA